MVLLQLPGNGHAHVVRGFVPRTSKRMLGFSWEPDGESAYLEQSLGVTFWHEGGQPPCLCRKMAGETDFLTANCSSQFPSFTFRRVVCQAARTNYFSFELLQLVKNSHSLLIPYGFSKRKDTFNTSPEEPVIGQHQELKAIKVQISNPIAAKCFLVRSHLFTVFKCM